MDTLETNSRGCGRRPRTLRGNRKPAKSALAPWLRCSQLGYRMLLCLHLADLGLHGGNALYEPAIDVVGADAWRRRLG